MTGPVPILRPYGDPLAAFLAAPDKAPVLAIIAEVVGPSYRPLGAMMTVFSETEHVGTLSSGCVESDIALNAVKARKNGRATRLRYGTGSPFMDIQLPCGGGLEILLLPNPDRAVLRQLVTARQARVETGLRVDLDSGALVLADCARTERVADRLQIRFAPALQFALFGKGPECVTFARLAAAAGYACHVASPDAETLDQCAAAGCRVTQTATPGVPDDMQIDDRTAVLLFFHDHDWEPPILQQLAGHRALYIGAQGSQRASDTRKMALQAAGVSPDFIDALHGPIGLIPSTRDPVTLSVSVFAEILAMAGGATV